MKTRKLFLNTLITSTLISSVACSSDDDNNNSETGEQATSKYVVAATSGDNDYLVGGSEISASAIYDATASTAIQSPGDRTWTFYNDDVVYGFLYNQTDAGTTSSYILDETGNIVKRNELALEVSIHTRGEVNDHLILAYSDRLRSTDKHFGYFYKVNPETDASEFFTVDNMNLLEEGETAYYTDIAEYQNHLIVGARSLNSSSFSSNYYNNTYIIVFNSDFTVKQVIKDTGRTGFVAGQWRSQGETGLEVIDNGDLYVFSSGQTNYADADAVTVPSGVLRINDGNWEFDNDYFFDITQASSGHNLFRTYYLGGTTFVVSMYPGSNSNATFGTDADRFAVIDVATQTFNWVTGFPTAQGIENDPFSIETPFIDKDNKQLVVPVTTSGNQNYLYIINPETAQASQSSQVTAEGIKAVGILEYKK
ncbi:DUF4374 domain-containing protein [Formosa sp. S-31]|uniref:DUF4374 domain-containing protein n=1 Tax=Formosa sp. S-31 TaxID=2790949 RepID=UPI003EB847AE